MKEKTWWSNNSLAVVVAILAFCTLTAGGIYLSKSIVASITEGLKNSPEPGHHGLKINPKKELNGAGSEPAYSSKSDQDSPFGPYMRKLQSRIKAAWYPPKGNETKRVTVFFNVDRQGNLHKLKVSPSGDPVADDAARKAVENAAPFDPLPAETKEKNVDIQFTFDYNVFDRHNHKKPSR